jgi:hypothetical protein
VLCNRWALFPFYGPRVMSAVQARPKINLLNPRRLHYLANLCFSAPISYSKSLSDVYCTRKRNSNSGTQTQVPEERLLRKPTQAGVILGEL